MILSFLVGCLASIFPMQEEEPVLTVYVKHYLTDEGLLYFESNWFPRVHSIISEQEGFLSILYRLDRSEPDLVDITLNFKDDQTLDAWIAVPIHDVLIRDLDIYRSRGYWKAVRTNDPMADPALLDWMTIIPGERK